MAIDFSKITPEDFEVLVEDLLRRRGFVIESRPSRGPDQGKDLLATRVVSDDMAITDRERWVVECKHLFVSGKSVTERDIGNFENKMRHHGANRFLLVTTTTVSESVKNQLLDVSNDESNNRKATFWARTDVLEQLQANPDIVRKYFGSWDSEACEAVNYIHQHLYEAHRGALLWCPGVTALFGNDGYASPTVQQEVKNTCDRLATHHIEQLASAQCANQNSWVVLARSADAHLLHNWVWESAYPRVKDTPAYREEVRIAASRLYTYWDQPHKL